MPTSDPMAFLEALPESTDPKETILTGLAALSMEAANAEDGTLLPSDRDVAEYAGLSRTHAATLLRQLCLDGVVRRVKVAGIYRYHVTRSWMMN